MRVPTALTSLSLLSLSLTIATPLASAEAIVTVDKCVVIDGTFGECHAHVPIGGANGVPANVLWVGYRTNPDCGGADLADVFRPTVLTGPDCRIAVALLVTNQTVSLPALGDDAEEVSSNGTAHAGKTSTAQARAEVRPMAARDGALVVLESLGDGLGGAVTQAFHGDFASVALFLLDTLLDPPTGGLGSTLYGPEGLARAGSDVSFSGTPHCYGVATAAGGVEKDTVTCLEPLP